MGFYLNTSALGTVTDITRPVRESEAQLIKLMDCTHWPCHSWVLLTFFQSIHFFFHCLCTRLHSPFRLGLIFQV